MVNKLIDYIKKINNLIYEYDLTGNGELYIYNIEDIATIIDFDFELNQINIIDSHFLKWNKDPWDANSLNAIFPYKVEVGESDDGGFMLTIYPPKNSFEVLAYSYINLISNKEDMKTFINLILDAIRE